MSNQRFIQKLQEQLRFMQNSASWYDAGQEDEAHRLALSMRVLFHNSGRQTSLLRRLKLEGTQMLSSVRNRGDFHDFVLFKIDLGSPTPVTSGPILQNQFIAIPLHHWMNGDVIHQFEGSAYHRRNLILTACDQDGGAHVDDRLESFYEDLIAQQPISIHGGNLQYRGPAPFDQTQRQFPRNTHLSMIRQFAHEVLASAQHFNWLGVAQSHV